VIVYYKLNKVGSTTQFDQVPYTLIQPDAAVIKSINNIDFTDLTFSVKDLEAFDAIKVKLVFRTTNSCRVPRIKDLRIVACA
jgi:acyl-[acyl carrier protein]--UDP-N-acetylglucosamine O-acyltransferase